MPYPILKLKSLTVQFQDAGRKIKPVNAVDLDVFKGEIMGLVGESGCGKTMTALAVLQLLPRPGEIVFGDVVWNNQSLLRRRPAQMRALRGREISLVFQDPAASFNPVFTVGSQMIETLKAHDKISAREAKQAAEQMLAAVGIEDPKSRLNCYPHQLSGGMLQRAMIALALICQPKLLIADEPTTALDVTIQAKVLDLIRDCRDKFQLGVLFISHNLAAVSSICDRLAIMYAGQIVELAPTREIVGESLHPYTQGLWRSQPTLKEKTQRFSAIGGRVADLDRLPLGCYFSDRCPLVMPLCRERQPRLSEVKPGHWVRCFIAGPEEEPEEGISRIPTWSGRSRNQQVIPDEGIISVKKNIR